MTHTISLKFNHLGLSQAGLGGLPKETVKEKAGQRMTVSTDSTWALIWMCVVDHRDGEPSVSMHKSLADALAELRKKYDADNKYADVPKHEFLLLVEIEHDLFIQVYPSRIDIARFERVDLDGWNALRDWEKELEN